MGEEGTGVAIALEALRGAVNTGFAELGGRLDVALQRTDTVERDIKDVKENLAAMEGDFEKKLDAMNSRVTSLEKKVWVAAGFAASLGAGGASLWQILGQ